jgi:hypothetical protein
MIAIGTEPKRFYTDFYRWMNITLPHLDFHGKIHDQYTHLNPLFLTPNEFVLPLNLRHWWPNDIEHADLVAVNML